MEDAANAIELWGGMECTVSRIGDEYRNQCTETGFCEADLDRIADLGIRTLRFPVLLETIAPVSFDEADWSWHDRHLGRLRELGIRVIATLCHHGSGPAYTDLLDPGFADILARHARRVAERYPWIGDFTPVNEPLTTARFSCLYGHWYPHRKNNADFLRALVNQCRATILCMEEIRKLDPKARLIQTEDLGRVFSTGPLVSQARYENHRRWLSFDLLCGRVDSAHPLWSSFQKAGIGEDELRLFQERSCPPDIIGINHYLTSDRFLDHRMELYPACHHGGNGSRDYADVEAVRCDIPARHGGPVARLREAWQRYRLPVAITEVHHGCTRDEQLRWLAEVWDAAASVRREGADIRAVTLWALIGNMDWNTLLTQRNGFYEAGAFDKRSDPPRLTAIGRAAQGLAQTGRLDHPVLDVEGWWRRDGRHYVAPAIRGTRRALRMPRKLLIAGGTGTLGQGLSRICEHRGLAHALVSRPDIDITDRDSIRAALDLHKPWAVINAAGFVDVARAEEETGACMQINAAGAITMAGECAAMGIPLVSFSSDLVFDGTLGRPYVEADKVNPTGVYGLSKARAERGVLNRFPDSLVIRTSAFFGPWDRYNFLHKGLSNAALAEALPASLDVVSPTYVPDLAHAVLELLIDGEGGIWHLANHGSISWYDFATLAVEQAGFDPGLVQAGDSDHEPANTALTSSRGFLLPPLDSAISRFFDDCPEGFLPMPQIEGNARAASAR